jgi:hypothetical protein
MHMLLTEAGCLRGVALNPGLSLPGGRFWTEIMVHMCTSYCGKWRVVGSDAHDESGKGINVVSFGDWSHTVWNAKHI